MSPTRINTSGLFTQIRRYKAAVPQGTTESAGILIEHKTAENFLATLGNASTCCAPAQATVTVDGCCDSASAPPLVLTRSIFLSGNGTWIAPSGTTSVEYLLVGGGGGGGGGHNTGAGGGGGGGSVKSGTLSVTPGASYSYTVGDGGLGGVDTNPSAYGENNGVAGGNSVFGTTITAAGGGFGYRSRLANPSGLYGSGGTAQSGDTATVGGSGGGIRDGGGNENNGAGGGGGGAGGAGINSIPNNDAGIIQVQDDNLGGVGGDGVSSTLKDDTVQTYGAGGKGGNEGRSSFIGPLLGASGAANTGNGGGGGSSNNGGSNEGFGGSGGSGIIVLKYYA